MSKKVWKYKNEWKIIHGRNGMDLTYSSWSSMRDRCINKRCKDYPRYGGRGITICAEWSDFRVFLKDMGERPAKKMSLGRIDNSKGYCKANCEWQSFIQQANNRRSSRFIKFRGKTKTLSQWAVHLGIPRDRLDKRISKYKIEPKKALTTDFINRKKFKVNQVPMDLPAIAREFGINYYTLWSRLESAGIKNGMSIPNSLLKKDVRDGNSK